VGVAKSGRRRIVVDGDTYLWAVYEDAELFGANIVMVISPDKKFYVRYALSQSASVRHLEKVDGLPDDIAVRSSDRVKRLRLVMFGA
jgi:hypothetical protein